MILKMKGPGIVETRAYCRLVVDEEYKDVLDYYYLMLAIARKEVSEEICGYQVLDPLKEKINEELPFYELRIGVQQLK